MDDFERELKTTFISQAKLYLADIEGSFLKLESAPGNLTIIDSIFRQVHNIKGSAQGVGFLQIGDFSHALESLLYKMKRGEIPITRQFVDLLLTCTDAISLFIKELSINLNAQHDFHPLKQKLVELAHKNFVTDDAADAGTNRTSAAPYFSSHDISAFAPDLLGLGTRESRFDSAPTYQVKAWDRYLCFNLGDAEYAIPLTIVKEVLAIPPMTAMPQMPKYVLGLTNLRGVVIPLLDLPAFLSIPKVATDEQAIIILNFPGKPLGVAVDSVNNVITPREKDLSPRPDFGGAVRSDFIVAVYRRDEKLVLFLDVTKCLGHERTLVGLGGQKTVA